MAKSESELIVVDTIKAIRKNSDGIHDFHFNKIDLKPNNIAKIVGALGQNTHAKFIHFSHCDIGDKGAAQIATLGEHPSLRILYLDHNDIGDKGTAKLASMFREPKRWCGVLRSPNKTRNTRLLTLKLDHNQIGDDGAMAMAEMLWENTSLSGLDLSDNKIGKEGGEALLSVLEHPDGNKTLRKLKIDGNHMGKALEEKIHDLLESRFLKEEKPKGDTPKPGSDADTRTPFRLRLKAEQAAREI